MVLHGKELGWVCLGSCAADVSSISLHVRVGLMFFKVIVNALALFWVTGGTEGRPTTNSANPPRNRMTIMKPISLGHIESGKPATFSQTPAYGYFPGNSCADSQEPLQNARGESRDIELGSRAPTPLRQPKNRTILDNIFRRNAEDQRVQVYCLFSGLTGPR